MAELDSFGQYVERRLHAWGCEFALHRDCEYLGHASKNMLQVLIDHRGEMPPPNTGYKPLEVDRDAQQIEDIVADIARENKQMACALRGYWCGTGRKKIERFETALLLSAYAGAGAFSNRKYMALVSTGTDEVRRALLDMARAA